MREAILTYLLIGCAYVLFEICVLFFGRRNGTLPKTPKNERIYEYTAFLLEIFIWPAQIVRFIYSAVEYIRLKRSGASDDEIRRWLLDD